MTPNDRQQLQTQLLLVTRERDKLRAQLQAWKRERDEARETLETWRPVIVRLQAERAELQAQLARLTHETTGAPEATS